MLPPLPHLYGVSHVSGCEAGKTGRAEREERESLMIPTALDHIPTVTRFTIMLVFDIERGWWRQEARGVHFCSRSPFTMLYHT